MTGPVFRSLRAALWQVARLAHRADFAWVLPFIARLPLTLGYALSGWRGRFNAASGRDWRSVALGFRHIRRQSLAGYRLLPGQVPSAIASVGAMNDLWSRRVTSMKPA